MKPRPADIEELLPLPELSLQILLALARGPLHGYGVIRDIEERTEGLLTVRSGSLYTTLQRLEEQGLAEPSKTPDGVDRRRKYYRITDRGRRVVRLETSRLARLLKVADARSVGPRSLAEEAAR